jgi:4-amino-4-deoxychorismate lyase
VREFPAVWVDGERLSALPLPDRGLDFGDGLFETLLLQRGRPLLIDYHWQRLLAGMKVLAFPDCRASAYEQLMAACAELVEIDWAALRLTVTRGSAPRGYAPPRNARARIVISAAPLQQDRAVFPDPVHLEWADIRWSSQPALAGIKHLNRLEQVLAAGEAQRLQCDDVVVLHQSGSVCSTGTGNLFAMVDGVLCTPDLHSAGIAGTRRRLVVEQLAPALGLEVVVREIRADELTVADELFCCNSLRGLQPVRQLANRHWESFPCCSALHERYVELMPC